MKTIETQWAKIALWKFAENSPDVFLSWAQNEPELLLNQIERKVENALRWESGTIKRGGNPDIVHELMLDLLNPDQIPQIPSEVVIDEKEFDSIYYMLLKTSRKKSLLIFFDDYIIEDKTKNQFIPDIYLDGINCLGQLIKKRSYNFCIFAFEAVKQLGEEVIPYLKSIYKGYSSMPEFEKYTSEFSSQEYVDLFNLDRLRETRSISTQKEGGAKIGIKIGNTHLLIWLSDKQIKRMNEIINSEILNEGECLTSERRSKIISQVLT